MALAGAFAGGQLGRAMGPGTITTGEGDERHELAAGHYLSDEGKLLTLERFGQANAIRFVTTSTLHGQSSVGAPWRHTDPEEWLLPDPCSSPVIE